MTPRRRAFTLVEILVSISIIAALLGMLLPALGGARESGRAVHCASNLRQLHVANELFASGQKGRYVPGAADFLANLERWHGKRDRATAPFDGAMSPLAPYLTPDSHESVGGLFAALRECPTFAPAAADLASAGAGFERSCGGYGYNNAFVGVERVMFEDGSWDVPIDHAGRPRDGAGAARARFASPARTAAFADAALASDRSPAVVRGTRLIEYSFIEPPRWPQWPAARPDPSIHFRHTGGANVAWLDGHVASEKLALTWTSGLYARRAARDIGWFAPAEGNDLFDYD